MTIVLTMVPRFPFTCDRNLEAQDCTIQIADMAQAEELLQNNEIDAIFSMGEDGTLIIKSEGSDSTKTAAFKKVALEAMSDLSDDAVERIEADVDDRKANIESLRKKAEARQWKMENAFNNLPDEAKAMAAANGLDLNMSIEFPDVDDFSMSVSDYLPVRSDWKTFDFYGPVFIGIFLFVFIFITSGMSLVNEKTAGTMERFLATPVRPLQILGGYVLGFGVLAAIQSAVVLWFSLNVMNFPNEGNVLIVVLIAVLMALASVTLGLLVSGLATSAFQVIQLMLLFVVPQILLSGLFDLSVAPMWLQVLGKCLPMTYGVDALRDVMLRGADLASIGVDLAVLAGFIVAFLMLSAIRFRKKHAR